MTPVTPESPPLTCVLCHNPTTEQKTFVYHVQPFGVAGDIPVSLPLCDKCDVRLYEIASYREQRRKRNEQIKGTSNV
jgi:hypothetical protein